MLFADADPHTTSTAWTTILVVVAAIVQSWWGRYKDRQDAKEKELKEQKAADVLAAKLKATAEGLAAKVKADAEILAAKAEDVAHRLADKAETEAKRVADKAVEVARENSSKLDLVHDCMNGSGILGTLQKIEARQEKALAWQQEHDASDNERFENIARMLGGRRQYPPCPDPADAHTEPRGG